MLTYKPKGTCSTLIQVDTEGDTIKSVKFTEGCHGNTSGISALVRGMNIDEAIGRLEGIQCQGNTSCPDQLAKALKLAKKRG